MTLEMGLMLALVVLLSGISKAAFAGGLGLLAMPMMLLVFDAHTALGVMLPLLIMLDAFTIRRYWQGWSWPLLWQLLPPALLGVAVSALLLGLLSARELMWVIGGGSVLFALKYFSGFQRAGGLMASKGMGWLLGFISGVSSTLLHAGGPPLAMHLLARKLPSTEHIATSALFFAVLNLVKLPAFIWQQQLNVELFCWALPFLPLCYFAIQLGYWLKQRVKDHHFLPIVHFLLLAAGLKLLWQSW